MDGRRCTLVTDLWDINANSCLEVLEVWILILQLPQPTKTLVWLHYWWFFTKDILFYFQNKNELLYISSHFTPTVTGELTSLSVFKSMLFHQVKFVFWKCAWHEIFLNFMTAWWAWRANLPVVSAWWTPTMFQLQNITLLLLWRGNQKSLFCVLLRPKSAGKKEQKWFCFYRYITSPI